MSMPRFNIINFCQNRAKTKLFLAKEKQNCQALGAPPPDSFNIPSIADFLSTRLLLAGQQNSSILSSTFSCLVSGIKITAIKCI